MKHLPDIQPQWHETIGGLVLVKGEKPIAGLWVKSPTVRTMIGELSYETFKKFRNDVFGKEFIETNI